MDNPKQHNALNTRMIIAKSTLFGLAALLSVGALTAWTVPGISSAYARDAYTINQECYTIGGNGGNGATGGAAGSSQGGASGAGGAGGNGQTGATGGTGGTGETPVGLVVLAVLVDQAVLVEIVELAVQEVNRQEETVAEVDVVATETLLAL